MKFTSNVIVVFLVYTLMECQLPTQKLLALNLDYPPSLSAGWTYMTEIVIIK